MSRSTDFLRQLPQNDERFNGPSLLVRWLHMDAILLMLLLMLIGSGLFVLYSGSGQDVSDVKRQGAHFGLGLILMLLVAQIDPDHLRRWSPWVYCAGLLGLIGVMVVGIDAKGAQRWLEIPFIGFRVQPSEFMKLAVPMMVAWYLSDRVLPPSPRRLMVALLIIFVPTVMILKQPDLGTSILIASSGIFVLLFAGLSWRWIMGSAVVAGIAAPLMWFFVMRPYQKQRVLTLLDPESDPLGAGWNIIQSKTAIGSGGMGGKGWLSGTQSQLDFLPEGHTDFIIAVLGEEFGFIGVLSILALYVAIVLRGFYIAINGQSTYARLVAGAFTSIFFVYVFVNMGMVSGILPIVGVPLPLVSYGGTSVLTLLASFGVLMSVHSHKKILKR
ncbi:rod shape-determining protein RodA [Allohahella marinimesophila]|uniref:Peptidoglycan glycosyltransferase MrdB n=1 Tax=Allohahella marinimesophila TaxID=1054972 RepID=A0ABP7NHL3_9GAMM